MKLTQRWNGHMRLQHGSVKFYEIMDGETVIGGKSVFVPRGEKNAKKHPPKTTYTRGDKTFGTAAEFQAAYEEEMRNG